MIIYQFEHESKNRDEDIRFMFLITPDNFRTGTSKTSSDREPMQWNHCKWLIEDKQMGSIVNSFRFED